MHRVHSKDKFLTFHLFVMLNQNDIRGLHSSVRNIRNISNAKLANFHNFVATIVSKEQGVFEYVEFKGFEPSRCKTLNSNPFFPLKGNRIDCMTSNVGKV